MRIALNAATPGTSSLCEQEMKTVIDESTENTGDPIADMLLRGEADTVWEAEDKYLDAHIREVIELMDSPISQDEFRGHPLIVLLMAHGSRGEEDSLL